MISVSQIGWSRYHDREGPFFGGNIKVGVVDRTAPFADRVLSLTAAAEGGGWNSINMYDSGLVSVGAIQFIDAGSFQVTDMLGAVADSLGVDYVLSVLKPALDICNATFSKIENKWRFSINGQIVNSLALQKQLYFGDLEGNKFGSFNEIKRLRAKTWAACFANIWFDPRTITVQTNFTLPRLINGFVWNELKKDLFVGDQPEDGWVGATRALLLAFAVNAPAVVVKRYAACRSNGKSFGTPEWCLSVLRGVIIGSGIDVWPARWVAKQPLIKKLFGVSLPSYNQLSSGKWEPLLPADVLPTQIIIEEEKIIPEIIPVQDSSKDIKEEIREADAELIPIQENNLLPDPIIVTRPSGAFETLIRFVMIMIEVITRAFRKNSP
jgi:hypothetical protein